MNLSLVYLFFYTIFIIYTGKKAQSENVKIDNKKISVNVL